MCAIKSDEDIMKIPFVSFLNLKLNILISSILHYFCGITDSLNLVCLPDRAAVNHIEFIEIPSKIERYGSDRSVCDGVRYLYIKTPQYTGNGLGRYDTNILSEGLILKNQHTERYFPAKDPRYL